MDRKRNRAMDVSESYYLLLELCCCEPTIQHCFSIIDNTCLAHGVTLKGSSPEFQHHIDHHWVPFLSAAIRAMHMYGFVPWRLKTLKSKDKVPEVLPPGTFTWACEVSKDNDAMLSYKVTLSPGARFEESVQVSEWVPPNYNVNQNSVMYATVASPMAYAIESYKHLQSAIKRQSHADAWNCTARLAVSHDPKEFQHDQHRRELLQTFDTNSGPFRAHAADPNTSRLEDMFYSGNHYPSVYVLPPFRHIDPIGHLQPCTNIDFLQQKYKADICSLMGVPMEMLNAREGSKNTASSKGVGRIFQAKMQRVCLFLKALLCDVHERIYKTRAEFSLTPMPRLEIADINDLKVLFEVGVLQPDHALDIAATLIGEFKKKKPMPQKPNAMPDPKQ